MTTMPQLGMEDSRPASSRRMPRVLCSEGIRKAIPLMKRKELAVASNETARIDQRAAAPSSRLAVVSVCIPHAGICR
ncbi:hypothetical protein A5714_19015 [Mycobacterium sp. E2462]|nr:hypothetical protein A5700_06070 [Mycobacterium sp. E1214]OBI09778.1 hypothetical protein A5714_19015 [Mycobacterium sp. E2462]